MYVVKRSFKNLGETLTAGTIIDNPAVIKRFKSKLAEGKIVEVTEQTFEQYKAYFKTKYGIELKANEDNDNTDDDTLTSGDGNTGNDSDEKSEDETDDGASKDNETSTPPVNVVKPVTAVATAKVITD